MTSEMQALINELFEEAIQIFENLDEAVKANDAECLLCGQVKGRHRDGCRIGAFMLKVHAKRK